MAVDTQKAPEVGEQNVPVKDISKDIAVNTAASTTSDEQKISDNGNAQPQQTILDMDRAKSWLGYVKTKQFWIVLFFGYVLHSKLVYIYLTTVLNL
jgi:hypothetical protein